MSLKVLNLSFSYGKQEIIKNLTFTVEKGELVAILGINGVGKSTMLKCIDRLLKPKCGEVLIDDININSYKQIDLAKKLGYVPQSSIRYDGTVFDSVLLGRKPYIKYDASKEDIDIVQKILDDLNLSRLAFRNVNEISGGEAQKVYIARALAQKTPILLFDEPTSNLDLKNQEEVLGTISKIVRENDFAALVSIHDINLALHYCNKFLLLKDGEIYAYGDESIITKESVLDVYGINCDIIYHDNKKVLITKE